MLNYLKNVKNEASQIIFPGFKEVLKLTGVTILFVSLVALFFYGFDTAIGQLIHLIG